MTSAFPAGLDALATGLSNATLSFDTHPALHNDVNDAVNKIEAELGILPKGSFASVKARLDSLGFRANVISIADAPYNVVPNTATNYSTQFTTAISDINAAGGGTLYIPPGAYRIKNVDILSNVMIQCAPGVTFKFPTSGVVTFDRLFFVGQGSLRTNIRFMGNGCTFDPSDISGYGSTVSSITGFVLEAARNFIIDGINGTGFKGGNILALNATTGGAHCELGVVRNIRDDLRTDPGYGCVQVTGARHILFENMWCSGGYALNFESDRRVGTAPGPGTDFVEDITAINLYAEKGASTGGIVVKFITHGNTIRRIRVARFRSVLSSQEGVLFTQSWDLGGVMNDIALEDGYIDTPTGVGVRRENGLGEYPDTPGIVFHRVRVVSGVAAGWQIGSSAQLFDCTAEKNATEGFSVNSSGIGPLPWRAKLTNCKAIGNGGSGFQNFGNLMLMELFRCQSEYNGIFGFQCGDSWQRLVECTYAHGQAGNFNGATGRIYYDRDSTKRPNILGPWSQAAVTASQTNVALATVDPPGAATAVTTVKMGRNGSIVGLAAMVRRYTDARTAGTATIEVLKNGAPLSTPQTTVLNASLTRYNYNAPIATGTYTYVAGDTIGLRITTDGTWAPATAQLDAWVITIDD